jgi:hypothetical protein
MPSVAIYRAVVLIHRIEGEVRPTDHSIESFEPIAEQFFANAVGGGLELTGGSKASLVVAVPPLSRFERISRHETTRARYDQAETSLTLLVEGNPISIPAWVIYSLAMRGQWLIGDGAGESLAIVDRSKPTKPKPNVVGIYVASLRKRWTSGELIEERERKSLDTIERNQWTPRVPGFEDVIFFQERARSPSIWIEAEGWTRPDFSECLEHAEYGRLSITELICNARNEMLGLRFVDDPSVVLPTVEAAPPPPPPKPSPMPPRMARPAPPLVASGASKSNQGFLWS